MKYFGTDGIRGVVGDKLNEQLLKKVAKAIVAYYNQNKLNKVLLVGNDSRISSDFCLSCLESVLLKYGIYVENVGVCSSPCLAFLTKKFNYPLGLMLSASHNSKEYNGLKFFNNNGEKVSDEFEENFEKLMEKKHNFKTDYAKHKSVEKLKLNYVSHLKNHVKNKQDFIYDCANGGTSKICKLLFPKQEKINCNPTGKNINENAGCTHIEFLRMQCLKKNKIGFAFDGDGDRISMVLATGEVVEGDKILYILSSFLQNKGNSIVGTIYTNSGLEKILNKRGISLIRAKVGDKNVYKKMLENNSFLGGEDSGHIILKTHTNTGDGVLTSIIIANLLELSNKSLSEILKDYTEHFQARKNLKVTENFTLSNNILNTIKSMENKGARIIIRPSGTEPVLRVFVEHKNKQIAENFLNELTNEISNI